MVELCNVNIRIWSLVAGLLHLLSAVMILALSFSEDRDLVYKLTINYADWGRQDNRTVPTITAGEDFVITEKQHIVMDLSLTWTIFVFFFLSFAFQTAAFFPQIYDYEKRLERGTNMLRFYEYSISSGTMLLAISTLCGIFNVQILLLQFFCMFGCNLFGLLGEQLRASAREEGTEQERQGILRTVGPSAQDDSLAWTAHVAGWVLLVAAWIPIIWTYVLSNELSELKAPDFVVLIISMLAILFNLFGINQLLQFAGVYSDATAEATYVVLSLGSKTLLGWMLYSNVLAMPSE